MVDNTNANEFEALSVPNCFSGESGITFLVVLEYVISLVSSVLTPGQDGNHY